MLCVLPCFNADTDKLQVTLHAPSEVPEGKTFFPNVTINQPANVQFHLSHNSINASDTDDYSFSAQDIEFTPPSKISKPDSPVTIKYDSSVEPKEFFNLALEFVPHATISADKVEIINPTVMVAIIDRNSEYLCHVN